MTTPRKNIADFEKEHGGSRIAELEAALKEQARKRHPIHLELPSKDNTLTFGAVADTHLGSRFEALDQLHAIYERFEGEGVTEVLHAGDIIDGHDVYKGQRYEIHAQGWEEQRKWTVDNYPSAKGITTNFIVGNHDQSFKKAANIDVGHSLMKDRPDMNYLGADYANVVFKTENKRKFTVGLMHPGGGSAYALSYKPQKIVEQLEGGTKPNLLIIGHFHKAEFMPSYRNVAVLQAGCLQWQTPFMVTKGLAAHVGAWIVRVCVQDRKMLADDIDARFIRFFSSER